MGRQLENQQTRSIDLTGLPDEAIQAVESIVALLRPKESNRLVSSHSVFNLFGKAPILRSGEAIHEQVRGERDAWVRE
jgi:hypothetical protein